MERLIFVIFITAGFLDVNAEDYLFLIYSFQYMQCVLYLAFILEWQNQDA